MSQTNRQLSCSKIWPAAEETKTGGVASALGMAQNTEESRVCLTRKTSGNGCVTDTGNAEPNTYGSGHMNPPACDMENHCCQTAVAPKEELLNADSRVGDSRSFSACATISETTRELCKAVSLSLGLAMESNDTGDMDAHLPSCDRQRGEYFFEVEAMPLNSIGAQAVAAEYKCHDQDARPLPGEKQLVGPFKSSESAARLQHLGSARTSVDEQNFTLCKDGDITSEEIDHLDAARTASCPYAQLTQGNLAHFGHATERPCRLRTTGEVAEFGDAVLNKFGAYQPEPYVVKIKSEDPGSARAVWKTNYTFNEKYNSQFWGSRQCVNSHGTGANIALCNPYERGIVRPEQWCPGGMLRPPYPNSSYVKAEVGEWLDVAYNGNR